MAAQESNVMKGNIGTSDYSQHKIQPWDIWEEYHLNPWDADIVKRVLRTKVDNTRRMDYEKIIHDCQKCIELIDKGSFIYDNILDREANYKRFHPELTKEEYKVLEEFRKKKSNNTNTNIKLKYKVGDEVFVKDKLWYNNNNIDGEIICGNTIFTKGMSIYCDRRAIITEVCNHHYHIDIDNGAYRWTDEMLTM